LPFGIKFLLTVETTVFSSQQLFPPCLLIWGIMQERVYNKGKIAVRFPQEYYRLIHKESR